ncbi:adenosylcobalamin-dependent ribonucleoside-diphosphate reductase [Candidatus Micrarchaeota archaeon]|nr:adenosylcobalamin-dependent ribonucleoside-diphosphate reductase [Candidatus Micrarchaeota archaeon]
MKVTKIRKRDGSIQDFDSKKIEKALLKALAAVKQKNSNALARKLASRVNTLVDARFASRVPSVEDVQDLVEQVLVENKLAAAAKAYILYRGKHAELREAKAVFGVSDELKLGLNAVAVLQKRYLQRDETGKVVETPSQLFARVARAVAAADARYGATPVEVGESEKRFFELMANRDFLPNSPTLMNADTPLGQLSACFVYPIGDSLKEIFDAAKWMALTQQSGGGVGFNFSRLRPKGDVVRSTMGVASGPVSFMRVFDVVTDVIKQGGKRRGANMGVLRFDHPDVVEFINAKSTSASNAFSNFNLSVGVSDEFMKKVVDGAGEYDLVNPRSKQSAGRTSARSVFDLICANAWRSGDPGLLFLDEINRANPTSELGEFEASNPCGEIPLLSFESCNLGSINVANFVEKGKIDFERLRGVVRAAVHFLDNVIDVNKFPLPQVETVTRGNRKIGLGVMGFAEMLVKLGVPYDSQRALEVAEKLMKAVNEEAFKASVELGKKRGSFPNFRKSVYAKRVPALRNATRTTIAPTGTISIIAGCSSGIEPLFAVSFVRNVMEGTRLLETNALFVETARKRGFYSSGLMARIARKGSVQGLSEVPKDVQKIFVTALDVAPEWHVRVQAAFQKHTDNAVSKTVNLPQNASVDEVRNAYLLAWKLKCKGITVFRYGSKEQQVLTIEPARGEERVSADVEYSGGCPTPACPV